MDINDPHYDINVQEYLKRMRFVADNGCQTVMLTGTSEPQQNKQFLAMFSLLHKQLGSPFTNIEMQTTGLFLNGNRNYVRFLRNFVGVNTIALSINSLSNVENNQILGHGLIDKMIDLEKLCDLLKEYDFNIRTCFNLNAAFADKSLDMILEYAKAWHADQVTFRKLYTSTKETEQGKWINDHVYPYKDERDLVDALQQLKTIGHTIYGTEIKEADGMSIIYDTDCMGKKPVGDAVKYLILRPNCKLYSSWDSKASLIF